MNTTRITKKLRAAIEVLSEKADCSEAAFIKALQAGKLKPPQLYKALQLMRYSWSARRGYWIWKPRHMKSIKRIFTIADKCESELFLAEAL